MEQAAALLTEGVLWLYLAGLSLGAAGGHILRRRRVRGSWISGAAFLASLGLLFFSLGLILVPQFVQQMRIQLFLVSLVPGILCGAFPRITVPILILLLAAGGILINRALGSMPGYSLDRGAVELLILRVDSEGGGGVELRHRGFSEVHTISVSRIRPQLLSVEIPQVLPWPRHRFLYLIGFTNEVGGTEIATEAASEDAQPQDRAAKFLEDIGIFVMDQVFGAELSIEPMLNYQIEQSGAEIVVSPLSFRGQTSDTGDE